MELQVYSFAEAKQPEYKEKKGEGYMQYGQNNDYPNYLLDLFNKSAKHNAIIKGKVNYITGNGWKGDGEFVKKVNRDESLDDITKKISLDIELFGGAYIQVIWSLIGGQIAELWHCDYSKIRTNKDNTQYWYKEDWKSKDKADVYPAFNPLHTFGCQIFYIKEYRPGISVYSLPGYFGALNYIESDIEVSKHVLGNAQTGFSASKLITLPNGEPSPDEKRNIDRQFTRMHTGADGKKFMLSFVNDSSRKPIVDDLGASDLTKEDFGRVDILIQTNIFSGHQITTPSLFGIAEAGKLGTRTEMRDGYEIFKNTYVNSKQMHLESVFNMLGKYAGVNEELEIQPVEPIGIEFSENIIKDIAPKEWILEKLGIDMTKYTPVVAVKQSFEDEMAIYSEFGDSKDNYFIWKSKKKFNEEEYQMFAEVSQIESNVLDLISKSKEITPEVIAETLKIDVKQVESIISDFIDKGYIKVKETKIGKGIDSNIIIERTLTEPLSKIVEKIKPQTTEILIRYSYEGPQDSKNRAFCAKMMELNRVYSRSEIETMSARLGYSVWDRRGGWYTLPGTETHREYCRHDWVSNIVTKKK